MPELPEIETIRKDLEKLIVGKKITGIKITETRSIRNAPQYFKKGLIGNVPVSIQRKGKLLIVELSNSFFLLARLGMTGQLIYSPTDISEKHTRIIICFHDNSRLFFNDIRKFGFLFLATKTEKDSVTEKMGIDALDKKFTLEYFKNSARKRKTSVKAFLLDQKTVSGIGNIYADEILYDSRLNPKRNVSKLNDKELKRLYNSIIRILRFAIKKRGTTFSDYVDARGEKGSFLKYLKIYGKEKTDCARCKKRSIERVKIAGRTTRFCKICQK